MRHAMTMLGSAVLWVLVLPPLLVTMGCIVLVSESRDKLRRRPHPDIGPPPSGAVAVIPESWRPRHIELPEREWMWGKGREVGMN